MTAAHVTPPALILASASPRRRDALTALGVAHQVQPAHVPEIPFPGEWPATFAARTARAKALAVRHQHPDAAILAADTVVTIEQAILGKPADAADACQMLQRLSGPPAGVRTHCVLTAAVYLLPAGHVYEQVVCSRVTFRHITPAEIEAYVATGEPMDKAGSYAIQGGAGRFVVAVDGSYSNIVGLPVETISTWLQREGHLPLESTHD